MADSSSSDPLKPKKALPLFGAMKGGTKYKLKTGTIGVGTNVLVQSLMIVIVKLFLLISLYFSISVTSKCIVVSAVFSSNI